MGCRRINLPLRCPETDCPPLVCETCALATLECPEHHRCPVVCEAIGACSGTSFTGPGEWFLDLSRGPNSCNATNSACNGVTLPLVCDENASPCHLDCVGTTACANATLVCPDDQLCAVTCEGRASCGDTIFEGRWELDMGRNANNCQSGG